MIQLFRLTHYGWHADRRCVSTSSDIPDHSDDVWALNGSRVVLGKLPGQEGEIRGIPPSVPIHWHMECFQDLSKSILGERTVVSLPY